ncbi:MAG TPA: BTAD domain-containing putative transcriptional regulator [Ktedonobacteraceae bacterium]|nr:BTAD domain-containing putative transcriptional regulator [Ktedonobacteraceae bacterium]
MQFEEDIPPSCQLRVCLHGPLDVWKRQSDGTWHLVEKETWGKGRMARAVFKRLLTAPGRRLSRGTIQDDLWPDSDNFELADKTVYNAINQIRHVVGKTLLRTIEASYELADQSLIWLDSDACDILLKEAENRGHTSMQALPLLERALGYLERGELLEGESGTWVYGLRKQREDVLRQCRWWLAESYEKQGKLWQAGEQYRAMVLSEPPDEEALQHWLEMLSRHGKRQDALKCYRDMKEIVQARGFTFSPEIEQATTFLSEQPSRALFVPPQTVQGRMNDLGDQHIYVMLRRQFLQQILGIISLSQILSFTSFTLEKSISTIGDYLSQCEENLFACWRLMKGREISVVQSVLCTWLPPLEQIIRESNTYRQRSASLAVQGYIIAGLITVLRRDYESAEWCCKQAVEYSELAEDPNLKVAALKHLATKYNSAKYRLKTLHTYQEALGSVEQASPLLQSRIYLGLALAYAQCGQKKEAFQYWDLTQQSFPAQPENDPSFLYADCGRSSLNHYGGLMYLTFGQADKAWSFFEEVVQMQQQTVIPERTIIEIVNCKAEAAIARKNLDLTCAHLREGVQGAIRLRSTKRFHDSFSLYKQARDLWPHEKELLELEELFH